MTSIAHGAIVPDMTVSEKISAIADARFAFARRAAIDGDEFAKRVFVADFQISRFAAIFQILRLLADRAVGVEFVFRAGLHRSAERDVMLKPAIWRRARRRVRSRNTGPTIVPGTEFRACGSTMRGRMNLHVAHLSRNVNISSPSETIASFTTQWHFVFAMRLPRALVSSA